MPASARFLSPHPPILFSPPAKHVASGSNNSFSSSSSSSNSRSANYFERLSRASAASAYLTDLTPPITPSNSNLEVESKEVNFSRVLKESTDSKTKLYPLVRSTILSDEDAGYRSDSDVVGTISGTRTAILKSVRGGPSRRALRLKDDHTQYPEDEVYGSEGDIEVPLLAEEHVYDHVVAEVPEVEEEVEKEYFDEDNFSRDFDRAMDLIYQEAMNGTSVAKYVASRPENQPTVPNTAISPEVDLLGEESDIQIPAKPVIRAMEIDSDCSPLSLCDDPSFQSISRSLVSPIQPNPIFMSPAIYTEPPVHGNSPLSSRSTAISALMFGSRGERRSFPMVDINGENLDIASLIRLEVAVGNNIPQPTSQQQMGFGIHITHQSRLPPSPFTSYPSLQSLENATNHSPRRGPFPVTPSRYVQDPSPAQDLKQTSVESGDSPRVRDISLSPLPVDRDQALVGLGLGALTEGCLRSSDSISKLDTEYVEPGSIVASDTNRSTANIHLNNQQCSPCVDVIEGSLKTEVEPSGVLSGSECLQSHSSLTSNPNVNQEVQVDLPSYQVNLGEYAGQVSVEGNISRPVEDILVELIVESESGPNVLSNSMPRTDIFSDLAPSGRRCSPKSHEDLPSQNGDRREGIQCTTPLIVQAPTFPGQHASSSLSNTVPITPDSINVRSTSFLADNVHGAEPTTPKVHPATWTDDNLKQSIEQSSLLFQDSPLRRLALALESDNFLARLGQSLPSPPALSIASNGQKNRSSRFRPPSLTVSPKNDPRSPCSPSMEYFHPESYIRGCLGVLPSAQSSSGCGNTPPLASPSRPDSTAFSSFGLLRESKSFEGLGIGLPSDLASGPLRCDSSILRANEVDRSDPTSTTEECQDIAQLADTISSPNDGTPSTTPTRVYFQVPTFVQRRLYVIPEQPTPLSTFSAALSRSPSPGSRPLKSTWSALSVLSGLRAASRSAWRSFSSKIKRISDKGAQIHDRRPSSSSSVNGHFCSLVEMTEGGPSPPSTKPNKFSQRFFQKIGSRRPRFTSSSSPPQPEIATVRSPGVIEYPDAPRGFKILTRQSGRGRLEPITRKFQVLF